MEQRKLGRATDQRRALLRNQVSSLLWYGKIETTYPRAKEVSKIAEKLLTLAINTYGDVTAKIETRKNEKNQDIRVEVTNDGPKRLAARRRIMAYVNDLQEIKPEKESKSKFYQRTGKIRHPLLERIFNELAPRYAERIKEKGNAGGYTRVLKLGERRGDAAEAAIIELV